MPTDPDWLIPVGLPAGVGAVMSTRAGGISQGPWAGLNLRPSVLPGVDLDDPAAVGWNQRHYAAALEGAFPVFLDQVHGKSVVRLSSESRSGDVGAGPLPQADASYTTVAGVACTVLVADCLPVLLAAPCGRGVAAAHAGWRGLAGGVLEATLSALCAASGCVPPEIHAWLGACIGPQRFEVGEDVRDAFGPGGGPFFRPAGRPGHWMADLPGLARWRLDQAGVRQVTGGVWCTASNSSRFFSYRRDRITGRHAASIWIR